LTPPPRDLSGNVIPHNHPGILDTDFIIRRISDNFIVSDPKAVGRKRLSSMAFQASSTGSKSMSVDLKTEIEQAGLNPNTYVTTPKFIGSVLINVGQIRQLHFQVGYEPISTNPHHGGVWGAFTRPQKNAIAEICNWFVAIPNVSIT
jgi:hypothetical protein